MKNHFYISYAGNKRNEVNDIYNNLNLEGIDTIIEPFCGTSAISYYLWTKHPELTFILNDNNKYLLEMYNIIIDDVKLDEFEKTINETYLPIIKHKEEYNKVVKQNNIYGWFISSKYYSIRPGLFPLNNPFNLINIKQQPIYDFYKKANIQFLNEDGILTYNKYKTQSNNLIIMDPPYLQTCNDFYKNKDVNIYEYLYDHNIKNEKAKIYLILENIWIIKLLFKDLVKSTYDKIYQTSKKNTNHIIVYNKL